MLWHNVLVGSYSHQPQTPIYSAHTSQEFLGNSYCITVFYRAGSRLYGAWKAHQPQYTGGATSDISQGLLGNSYSINLPLYHSWIGYLLYPIFDASESDSPDNCCWKINFTLPAFRTLVHVGTPSSNFEIYKILILDSVDNAQGTQNSLGLKNSCNSKNSWIPKN